MQAPKATHLYTKLYRKRAPGKVMGMARVEAMRRGTQDTTLRTERRQSARANGDFTVAIGVGRLKGTFRQKKRVGVKGHLQRLTPTMRQVLSCLLQYLTLTIPEPHTLRETLVLRAKIVGRHSQQHLCDSSRRMARPGNKLYPKLRHGKDSAQLLRRVTDAI